MMCTHTMTGAGFSRLIGMTVLGLLLAGARPASAAGPGDPPGRWWVGLDLGAGQLRRSLPEVSESKPRFYFSLEGGVTVTPQLLVGLEVGGWLLQAENPDDPTRGAAISPLFVTARIYPSKMSTFHIRLGGGSINAWNNAVDAVDQWGTGWEAGFGYDVQIRGRHHITPFVLYSRGSVGQLDISAVTVGAGYTWR